MLLTGHRQGQAVGHALFRVRMVEDNVLAGAQGTHHSGEDDPSPGLLTDQILYRRQVHSLQAMVFPGTLTEGRHQETPGQRLVQFAQVC